MTADTTTPSYWLNWRFLLCAIWILVAIVVAAFIIRKREAFIRLKNQQRDHEREKVGTLYKDEAWTTCSKRIHPVFLLTYRVIGFNLLVALLLSDAIVNSAEIFYFYTEWTFTLVTIYFGLASVFSIHGCLHYRNGVQGESVVGSDAESGTYVAPTLVENGNMPNNILRSLNSGGEPHVRKIAGSWEYTFQIIFQTCAGAVVLTDIVFWFIFYPFLANKDYSLDFLKVSMHTVNFVVFLGDVILNSLRFPLFRVAYFILWTSIFVIFQWIIHASVYIWWPYPFLDLSSPYAPIWYLAVGLLVLPCYGVFAVIMLVKKFCLSKLFLESDLNVR